MTGRREAVVPNRDREAHETAIISEAIKIKKGHAPRNEGIGPDPRREDRNIPIKLVLPYLVVSYYNYNSS